MGVNGNSIKICLAVVVFNYKKRIKALVVLIYKTDLYKIFNYERSVFYILISFRYFLIFTLFTLLHLLYTFVLPSST